MARNGDRCGSVAGRSARDDAHTCIEATVRFAAELGYDVTVVKDAVADYSDEHMHAALDINIPNYARAIVTTREIVDAMSSL